MVNAEYAAADTGDNFSEMFTSMDDEYMKAREADGKDISNRLVRNLQGQAEVDFDSMEPSIEDRFPPSLIQNERTRYRHYRRGCLSG